MRLNNWKSSGKPQNKSCKTPKAARRKRRMLAKLAQKLRKAHQ